VKKYGLAGILRKQLRTGDPQEQIERMLNSVFLTLGKSKRKARSKNYLVSNQTSEQPEKSEETNLVKILGKSKTYLPDF